MNFISEEDMNTIDLVDEYYMQKIDINKDSTRRLIEKIGRMGLDDKALEVLNSLGQNIESINTWNYSYKHLGKDIQMSELCRGEQVFLVSYAAKVTGIKIFLQYDMMQLTKTSLRKYYQIFKDCDNINIVYLTQEDRDYLSMAMQGEI